MKAFLQLECMQVKGKSLAAFGSLFLIGLQLHARVFVVTITQDTTNVTSLRGAIIAANALGGKNIIFLRQGTYGLNLYVYGVDEPPGYWGGLVINTGDLTIVGDPNATINASGLIGRGSLDNVVFHISSNARVRFENLIITGGAGNGGGVDNEGTLTLRNCDITGNSSFGSGGGGIYNSGDLSMVKCNVSNNSGGIGFSANGGGIHNVGNLVMNNCVVGNNSTKAGLDGGGFGGGWIIVGFPYPGYPGEDAGDGGGIYNAGNLIMFNSIVSRNTCGTGGNGTNSYDDPAGDGGNGGNGGGIYNAGNLAIYRCRVDNNSAGAGGNGGNSSYDVGPPKDGNGGNGGNGGGIFNAADASHARLIRTSVDLNSGGSGGEPGTNGNPGLNGSGPNLFGDFTISRKGRK